MTPVISVVIACRDAQATLPTQLAALERQQLDGAWEVLLCDNGSTDGSVETARRVAGRLPLRVVDASDCVGAGPVRNRGVLAARAPVVAFCDADDEVAEGWLAAMVAATRRHPLVAGRFDGSRLNTPRMARSRSIPQQQALQQATFGARLPHAGAGNLAVSRSVFLSLGGFDPQLRWLEDTDFCWRAQLSGVGLRFEPDALVHLRLRTGLRGALRQGWEYGRAHAVLEQRYPLAGPRREQRQAADTEALQRGRGPAATAWRFGWAAGHRWQRADATSPVAVAPPVVAASPSVAAAPSGRAVA
jgi:glycosyltransferase involved in cell wall biosynthesis